MRDRRDRRETRSVHQWLGDCLSLLGWHAGAARALRDAVAADTCSSIARLKLGEAELRCGHFVEAAAAFDAAVRLDPVDHEARGNLVIALARARRWPAALDALRGLIEVRPAEAELYVLLGVMQRKLRRHTEAIRSFRWAVHLSTGPHWQRLFLGEAVLGAAEWERAVASLRFAQAGDPEARSQPRPIGLLAQRQSILNHYPPRRPRELARRQCPMPARPSKASVGVARVNARLRRAVLASASAVHLRLGALLARVTPHLAIRALRRGASARDSGPAALTRVATVLAVVGLGGALELRALGQTATESLRSCYASTGDHGVDACRRALAIGLTPARMAAVRRVLALRFASLERWADVVATYREQVEAAPADADAHRRLGEALLHLTDGAEEAAAVLEVAVLLDPTQARAHVALGEALARLGRFEVAVACFEEALRIDAAVFAHRPAARRVKEAAQRGERWP